MDFATAANLNNGSSSTEWLKLEGTVRIRFVSEVEPFISIWDNKEKKGYRLPHDAMLPNGLPDSVRVSFKYLAFVINKTDPKNPVVCKVELPQSVIKQIGVLQKDEDYKFDKYPPYDVKITKDGVEKKTRYTVLATNDTKEVNIELEEYDAAALVKAITSKSQEEWDSAVTTLMFIDNLAE